MCPPFREKLSLLISWVVLFVLVCYVFICYALYILYIYIIIFPIVSSDLSGFYMEDFSGKVFDFQSKKMKTEVLLSYCILVINLNDN